MQITSSFPVISLGDWVAGLHFMKELSGKKTEEIAGVCSEVYYSFS